MIGRQKLDGIGIGQKVEGMRSMRMPMEIDLYLPIFTLLQFFFYMGLLKVSRAHNKKLAIFLCIVHIKIIGLANILITFELLLRFSDYICLYF